MWITIKTNQDMPLFQQFVHSVSHRWPHAQVSCPKGSWPMMCTWNFVGLITFLILPQISNETWVLDFWGFLETEDLPEKPVLGYTVNFRFARNFFLLWVRENLRKGKMCGKNNFYSKSFVIFWNFLVLGEILPKNPFLSPGSRKAPM